MNNHFNLNEPSDLDEPIELLWQEANSGRFSKLTSDKLRGFAVSLEIARTALQDVHTHYYAIRKLLGSDISEDTFLKSCETTTK